MIALLLSLLLFLFGLVYEDHDVVSGRIGSYALWLWSGFYVLCIHAVFY